MLREGLHCTDTYPQVTVLPLIFHSLLLAAMSSCTYTPYSDTDSTYLVLQGIELNFSVAYSLGGPWR